MFERKAISKFENWYEHSPHKALLVKGARQVGKTYLIKAFAAERFENVVAFDMVADTAARDSFASATSVDDLFLRMSVAADAPMVAGKTLIFIDEVQFCPNVVTFIKYLVQRDDYRFALSGSLLGVEIENIDSLPVGYVDQVEMYPMDFEEFCWANGLDKGVYPMAESLARDEKELPEYLFDRLMSLFHRYLMVGGMPDAVAAFVGSGNLDEVRRVHENIHDLYRYDITKYAPEELRLVIRDIYDLIPSELGSKNKRFKLSSIEGVKRFSQVTDHFLWLAKAGVALPVYSVSAPTSPLLLGEQRNLFKLFYLDTGMLLSSYPKSVAQALLAVEAEDGPKVNLGAAYEGFVAQELKAHGFALRYFASKKIGELDFVVEDRGGEIAAIEVKSGKAYTRHAALDNALGVKGYSIDSAIVLAEANVHRDGKVLYLPIFMAGMLSNED